MSADITSLEVSSVEASVSSMDSAKGVLYEELEDVMVSAVGPLDCGSSTIGRNSSTIIST